MNKRSKGFTLIEIMLVIVLMSISAAAVIINLPDTQQDIAKEQAQRFFYRLQLLNEHAILNGDDLAIRVDEAKRSYTYMKLNSDGWQVFENKVYASTQLQDGMTLSLEVGGDAWSQNESLFKQESFFDEDMFAEYEEKKKVKSPQLLVLSSGEMTAFHLSIIPKGESNHGWVVDVKESGSMSLMSTDDFNREKSRQ